MATDSTDNGSPIYLDNAATTPISDAVRTAMEPYLAERFGNPSSLYAIGGEAKNAVETAREQVAGAIGAKAREIVFTSGGTEANNMALKGVADYARAASIGQTATRAPKIVISAIEHSSVLNCAEQLAQFGCELAIAPVDSAGVVDFDALERLITPETVLVSIALVNNEIGTLQDVPKIGALVAAKSKEYGRKIVFHTDAIQALGKVPLDVAELGVDLLTLSGHKVGAPKGVGALYVRRGTQLEPLIVGGGQEQSRRGGTENVPYIVAMGAAAELASEAREQNYARYEELSAQFIRELRTQHPDVMLNSSEKSVPSIVNVSFPRIAGETLLLGLDFAGVYASSGSACSSASIEPSHVLTAIGLDEDRATNSVRFSFGPSTTAAQLDQVMQRLAGVLEQLAEYG